MFVFINVCLHSFRPLNTFSLMFVSLMSVFIHFDLSTHFIYVCVSFIPTSQHISFMSTSQHISFMSVFHSCRPLNTFHLCLCFISCLLSLFSFPVHLIVSSIPCFHSPFTHSLSFTPSPLITSLTNPQNH